MLKVFCRFLILTKFVIFSLFKRETGLKVCGFGLFLILTQIIIVHNFCPNMMCFFQIPEMLLYDSDEQEKTGTTHKEVKKKHSGNI